MKDYERRDKIRGCLFGGAVGDALGYPVEFLKEKEIFREYGRNGIQSYKLNQELKALISDDTQMTLFTANGLLAAQTIAVLQGQKPVFHKYVAMAYQDWLSTQGMSFEQAKQMKRGFTKDCVSWLMDVPELFKSRAPGGTCMSALWNQRGDIEGMDSYIARPVNSSKGCGGVMRVAPAALIRQKETDIKAIDYAGAELAAITHGHSLGYMTAAVLVHVIYRIVYAPRNQTFKEIVWDAKQTVCELFSEDIHVKTLENIIELAVNLAENNDSDLNNIHKIGEGWVGEEALAIAVYCALRYENDFSAGIIAAVNHRGDSDSTGAITGNILGALLGYESMDEQWKNDLELTDVLLEMADDLYCGCPLETGGEGSDERWKRKYIHMQRR